MPVHHQKLWRQPMGLFRVQPRQEPSPQFFCKGSAFYFLFKCVFLKIPRKFLGFCEVRGCQALLEFPSWSSGRGQFILTGRLWPSWGNSKPAVWPKMNCPCLVLLPRGSWAPWMIPRKRSLPLLPRHELEKSRELFFWKVVVAVVVSRRVCLPREEITPYERTAKTSSHRFSRESLISWEARVPEFGVWPLVKPEEWIHPVVGNICFLATFQ